VLRWLAALPRGRREVDVSLEEAQAVLAALVLLAGERSRREAVLPRLTRPRGEVAPSRPVLPQAFRLPFPKPRRRGDNSTELLRSFASLLAFAALVTACSDKDASSAAATSASTLTSGDHAKPEGTCPVTIANRTVPQDATDWGPEDSHGNGKLWTLFWPYGVVVADEGYVEDDGSIGMKWPWWRGVRGTLTISGRRLDQPAPPIRADVNDAYGLSGFQPSSIYFPNEGCWEVTGKVGGASLTFVTLVLKASTYALELKTE
jgi:hypothetical protein